MLRYIHWHSSLMNVPIMVRGSLLQMFYEKVLRVTRVSTGTYQVSYMQSSCVFLSHYVRIRRMTGGYVFTGICPSTLVGGEDTPSQVWMGGTPIPCLDMGYPPCPGLDGVALRPGLDGSTSIRQDWMENPPPVQDWMGPHCLGLDGVPLLQDWMGYPPIQDWMGYPCPGLDGIPPPPLSEQHGKHLLCGGRYASCVSFFFFCMSVCVSVFLPICLLTTSISINCISGLILHSGLQTSFIRMESNSLQSNIITLTSHTYVPFTGFSVVLARHYRPRTYVRREVMFSQVCVCSTFQGWMVGGVPVIPPG